MEMGDCFKSENHLGWAEGDGASHRRETNNVREANNVRGVDPSKRHGHID